MVRLESEWSWPDPYPRALMWRGGAAVKVVAIPSFGGFVIGADRFATRNDAPQTLAHAFQVLGQAPRVTLDRSLVVEMADCLDSLDRTESVRLRDKLRHVVDSRPPWCCDVAGCPFEHEGEKSDE